MSAAEERDAIDTRRAERIVGALKARGVTVDLEEREGEIMFVRAVDAKGKHRGIRGRVKLGEGPVSLRRRLLWTLAIDVEHDEVGCQCRARPTPSGSCPAARALLRRLKEAS